jgi:hypothetical protein
MDKDKIAFETHDVNLVNQLSLSGDYRSPVYDTHRSMYILIKRTKK